MYWGLFAFSMHRMGKLLIAPSFDNNKVDGLTKGLSQHYQKQLYKTPAILKRLKQSYQDYAKGFEHYDLMLTPVLAHTTPELGHLHPEQDFETLIQRLRQYASFTPYNNTSGGPAISLPLGHSSDNTPIGLQFSANHGDEKTLLELAFELEEAKNWKRIYE